MKILAITIIKNEADIIKTHLAETSKWADHIFVVDNGSTDGTWELVKEMKSDVIIPWKKDNRPFHDTMRAAMFKEFKHYANEGDWWCCKHDADELYIDNPRKFLAKVPKMYHVVYSESIEFYLTEEDVSDYEYLGNFEKDKSKINYYRPYSWSELVFFKHRNRLKWRSNKTAPDHVGLVYPKKIWLKHYKYRSPDQMKRRLESRQGTLSPGPEWKLKPDEWKQLLKKRSDMLLDTGAKYPVIKGCRNQYYKEKRWIQMAKYFLHYTKIWP